MWDGSGKCACGGWEGAWGNGFGGGWGGGWDLGLEVQEHMGKACGLLVRER